MVRGGHHGAESTVGRNIPGEFGNHSRNKTKPGTFEYFNILGTSSVQTENYIT